MKAAIVKRVSNWKKLSLAVALMAALTAMSAAASSPEKYNVVWDSPSANADGSMPLGNGETSLNAWVNPTGELVFYIGRTDSWGDNGRLLKLGRVVVTLDPAPPMQPFKQTLSLVDGTMRVVFGEGNESVELDLWVDANHPVVNVDIDSQREIAATARIELWRTEPSALPSVEVGDILFKDPQNRKTVVEPDTILSGRTRDIGWYHRNIKSVGPELTAELQGTAGYERDDPLLHRTFGAIITAEGAERIDDLQLRSPSASEHSFRVFVDSLHPASEDEWLALMDGHIAEIAKMSESRRRAAHERWWSDFWERSWIAAEGAGALIPANDHELLIGRDQSGNNRFRGEIRAADISGSTESGLLKLTAEVKPAAGEKGRIFDKITPAKSDGFLIDAEPGNGLRLITGSQIVTVRNALPAGEWARIEAVADPDAGGWLVKVDGKTVIDTTSSAQRGDADYLSWMYALQRFVTACGGRGEFPIKFNGGTFTVPAPGKPGDADYRRWGQGYWWQNTRLPYFAMPAAGDLEMMASLFELYIDRHLPVNEYRTRRYFDFDGAFYPECVYFWGDVFTEVYGWQPMEQRDDPLQVSRWHKWEWVAGPEMLYLALDYYEHSGDKDFLRAKIIPTANAVMRFFDNFYDVGPDGKLVMHPAMACETWWDCTNPMPELAGLTALTQRLLALDSKLSSDADREFWKAFQAKLPALPTREVAGVTAFAPAEKFAQHRNVENPELYGVFPFRLASFNRPNAELGRNALKHRWHRGNSGWRQDDIFMAYLGETEQVRSNIIGRARKHDPRMRFPAFWGPNYDWTPDQTHGGVLMKTLQSMLMQTEPRTGSEYDGKIYLLPAWPRDWDVSFKLHAPGGTTVECEYRDGRIEKLKVRPRSRRKDVVIVE